MRVWWRPTVLVNVALAVPKRLANRATYVLLALVIAVAGFVGGVQVQKHYGTREAASTGTGTAPDVGQFPGGGQVPGGAGRASGAPGAGGRGGITGTVKLVDGTTIHIETPDGRTITVRSGGGTAVLTPGRLTDLPVGSTVTGQGQSTDGTVAATSVTRTG